MKRALKVSGSIFGIIVIIGVALFGWWNTNPVLPGTPKFVRDWAAKQSKTVNFSKTSVFLGSTAYKCESQGTTYYELTISGESKLYLKDGTYLCDVVAKSKPVGCPTYVTSSLRECSVVWKSRTK